jgi:hypothetical protein
MAFFEIITVKAYWNCRGGKPFVNSVEPINNDIKMVDVIARLVRDKRPNEDIDFDSDIKSITASDGTDVIRLANLPISIYCNQILQTPRELCVVIAKPVAKPTVSLYSQVLKARAPANKFEPKFAIAQVNAFQVGYHDAKSKSAYLDGLDKDGKPS